MLAIYLFAIVGIRLVCSSIFVDKVEPTANHVSNGFHSNHTFSGIPYPIPNEAKNKKKKATATEPRT